VRPPAAHPTPSGGGPLDPEVLARTRSLALRVRMVVDGRLGGVHRGRHHGSSIEFAEHKEYAPGDDLRRVDWRAFARADKLYVKRFEQEASLQAILAVDASGSMGYGHAKRLTKLEYASVLAASLASILLRQQDAVGLVTWSHGPARVLPPRRGLAHLAPLVERLEGTAPSGTTDLPSGLAAAGDLARRRGVIAIFSDLLAPAEPTLAALRHLTSRGHEVLVFHVLDGDELDLPFQAMTLFEGLETDHRLLVEPRLIRARYLRHLGRHLDTLRRGAAEAGARYLLVDTRRSPVDALTEALRAGGTSAQRPPRGATSNPGGR